MDSGCGGPVWRAGLAVRRASPLPLPCLPALICLLRTLRLTWRWTGAGPGRNRSGPDADPFSATSGPPRSGLAPGSVRVRSHVIILNPGRRWSAMWDGSLRVIITYTLEGMTCNYLKSGGYGGDGAPGPCPREGPVFPPYKPLGIRHYIYTI